MNLRYQASLFESSFGDGFHEGEAVGVEKGIEIGIEQTKKEIALKLIQQDATIENIMVVTGLSHAAIDHLINNE